MNRIALIIIAVLILAVGVLAYFVYHPYDPIAASFSGESITRRQLQEELEKRYGQETLEDLISQSLIKKALATFNFKLTDQELAVWVEDYKRRPDAQEILASGQFDDEKLRENLKLSIPLFYMSIADIPEKDRIKYFEEHKGDFEEMELKHILLGSEEEGMELLDRIKGKDGFDAMAAIHSLDLQTSSFGGCLGRVTRNELAESFTPVEVDSLFQLKPGEISLPVQSNGGGWHLFFVKSKITDYDRLKYRVVEVLGKQKLPGFLDKLREKAKVQFLLPEILGKDSKDKEAAKSALDNKTTNKVAPGKTPAASQAPKSDTVKGSAASTNNTSLEADNSWQAQPGGPK